MNLFEKCLHRNRNLDQGILHNGNSNNVVEVNNQPNLNGNQSGNNIIGNNANESEQSIDHIERMEISNTQSAPTEEEYDIHTESGV